MLAVIYVHIYGVNVLFLDEFEFVDMFNDKVDFWKFILKPHNEHFMPLGKLEYFTIASFTSMNSKACMYVTLFICTLPYFCLVNQIKTKNVFIAFACIVLFYLAFFSPLSYESLLWGFQPPYLTAYAFGILSILFCYYYLSSKRNLYLIFSTIFCIVASLNSSHGVLSWTSILLLMIYSREFKKCLLALAPSLLIAVYYLIERSKVSFQTHQGDQPLIGIFQYFFSFIASRVFNFNIQTAWVFGLIVVTLLLFLIVSTKIYRNYLFTSLVIFGVLIAALVAFGRWRSGISQAFSSRYFQLQMPIYLALGVLISSGKNSLLKCGTFSKISLISNEVLSAFFIILLLVTSITSIQESKRCYVQRARTALRMRAFEVMPKVAVELNLYPNYDRAKKQYEIIKSKKLNVFSSTSLPQFDLLKEIDLKEYTKEPNPECLLKNFELKTNNHYLGLLVSGWCLISSSSSKGTWNLIIESSNRFYSVPLNSIKIKEQGDSQGSVRRGFHISNTYYVKDEIKYPVKLYLLNSRQNEHNLFDINMVLTQTNQLQDGMNPNLLEGKRP